MFHSFKSFITEKCQTSQDPVVASPLRFDMWNFCVKMSKAGALLIFCCVLTLSQISPTMIEIRSVYLRQLLAIAILTVTAIELKHYLVCGRMCLIQIDFHPQWWLFLFGHCQQCFCSPNSQITSLCISRWLLNSALTIDSGSLLSGLCSFYQKLLIHEWML